MSRLWKVLFSVIAISSYVSLVTFAKNYLATSIESIPNTLRSDYELRDGYLLHKLTKYKYIAYGSGVVLTKAEQPLELAFYFEEYDVKDYTAVGVNLVIRGEHDDYNLRFYFPFKKEYENSSDADFAITRPPSNLNEHCFFKFQLYNDYLTWLPTGHKQRVIEISKHRGFLVDNIMEGFSYYVYATEVKNIKFGVKADKTTYSGFGFPESLQPISTLSSEIHEPSTGPTVVIEDANSTIVMSTNATETVSQAGFKFFKHWELLLIGGIISFVVLIVIGLVIFKCYQTNADEHAQRMRIRQLIRQSNNVLQTPPKVPSNSLTVESQSKASTIENENKLS